MLKITLIATESFLSPRLEEALFKSTSCSKKQPVFQPEL